jgi:hypothetical protein
MKLAFNLAASLSCCELTCPVIVTVALLVRDGDGKAPQSLVGLQGVGDTARDGEAAGHNVVASHGDPPFLILHVIGRVMPSHERSLTIDAIGVVAGRVPHTTPVEGATTRVARQLYRCAMRLVGDRRDGMVGCADRLARPCMIDRCSQRQRLQV